MLGGYLAAVIRRYAGDAWATLLPGADGQIVKNVFTHDPEQYDFKANDLPALYLFRAGSAKDPENLTADWRVTTDKVSIFWILPPREGVSVMPAIARAVPFVAKLIDSALRRGRDPSYIVEGDTDPQAPRYGSVVIRAAGLMQMNGGQWKSGLVAIKNFHGDKKNEPFAALMSQITITEVFDDLPGTAVPDELGPTAEVVFPAKVHITETVNGGEGPEYRDPLDLVVP